MRIPEGLYKAPPIGTCEVPELGESVETKLGVDTEGNFTVHSPLYADTYVVGDGSTFQDPRADAFTKAFATHQFHHLGTRQLSLPERFETRNGAGRYTRLGDNLDSARFISDLGGTFEQVVQTLVSDAGHPAGSHLRGDHMVGDYKSESSHDKDLYSYIVRCGLRDYLVDQGLVEEKGLLIGSTVTLESLCDPSSPRAQDIAECDRPDGNADRIPFTMHEAVLMIGQEAVQEAMGTFIRIETDGGDRIATTSVGTARIMYELGDRHRTEHWNSPMQSIVIESLLAVDRYGFLGDPSLFGDSDVLGSVHSNYPVDHVRVSEHKWYEHLNRRTDGFSGTMLNVAEKVAAANRAQDMDLLVGSSKFAGPPSVPWIDFEPKHNNTKKTSLTVDIGRHDAQGQLLITLPRHKDRAPINMPVVTRNGVKRITEIDPSLVVDHQARSRWLGASQAIINLNRSDALAIAEGTHQITKHWSSPAGQRKQGHPLNRTPMNAAQMQDQINQARQDTIAGGLITV